MHAKDNDMKGYLIERLRRSRLRVQQMELVLQLIEHGTISAAAKSMGLTQSAVTRSLQDLESLMEVTLFKRSRSGVTPTQACRPLETLARDFRRGLEDAARQIQACGSGDEAIPQLGAEPGTPSRLLGQAVEALLREQPGVQLSIRCETRQSLLDLVGRGEMDLALVRTDLRAGMHLHRLQVLAQHRLRLVCGKRHPLASCRMIDPQTLSEQRWLLPAAGHPVTRRVDLAFSQRGIAPPAQRIEAEHSPMLLSLLASGSVVGAIDAELAAEGLQQQRLIALPDIIDLEPVTVFAAEPLHRRPDALISRLSTLLQQPANQVADRQRA